MSSNNNNNATSNNNTPSTVPETSNRPSRNSNSRSGSNSRGRNNNNIVQNTDGNNFEGACTDINAVVALRTERMNKKVPYIIFTERVADYVLLEITFGSDLESCIRFLDNPKDGFDKKT